VSNALLVVALGPVQQFIGQARRMRDLWFGSHLLSEMSRAVAQALAEDDWELVFPALNRRDLELEPCDGSTRPETGKPPLGIANKIVAWRPETDAADAERVGVVARAAAVAAWRRLAAPVLETASELIASDLAPHETPEQVIDSFLECYVAWSTYVGDGDFAGALDQAEQALAARKALRNFAWWEGRPVEQGARKSSLDGQRETILFDRVRGEMRKRAELRQARELRLGLREQLDGIGLVKRAGGDPDPFVPIARVAIEPWLNAIDQAKRRDPQLYETFSNLENACVREDIPRTRRGLTRWLDGAFPYDAEIFLEGQWPALTKELDLKPANGTAAFFKDHVRPLFRSPLSLPEPYPYVACLRADGDHMGKTLDALATAAEQRGLSERLAVFAAGVRDIVESHSGLHIYAGGDDVLAFLPVVHAIDCAEKLRAAFIHEMEQADLPLRPTLSIGIGIAHCLTPLAGLLRLGKDAETFAKRGKKLRDGDKRQRNALAVIVDKRSGDTLRWRRQWDDGPSPGERVGRLRELLGKRGMPSKLPYELRPILDELNRIDLEETATTRAWRHEVARVVARKRADAAPDDKLTPEAIGLRLPNGDRPYLSDLRAALTDWIGAAMTAHAVADADRNIEQVRERKPAGEDRDGR
jgi:CRISPR-associated protein Cmr2